ncbi:hypothetical protein [Thermomonospora umbrina]|uniref:hypothetical protein n=1 Tax=Thermomonospora umbrina TaxID=111806 RepID=UPI0011C0CA70|nr:hypothetical protein [Thermomonospora umbrina]
MAMRADPGRRAAAAQPEPAGLRLGLVLLGAHGGAGTTTLARLLEASGAETYDLGRIGPRHALGGPAYVEMGDWDGLVLVSRNTVAAAGAATLAVRGLVDGGHVPHLLVVVSDGAGTEPKAAKARFDLVEPRLATGIVRMPFEAGLRLVDDPTEVRLHKATRAALERICALRPAPPRARAGRSTIAEFPLGPVLDPGGRAPRPQAAVRAPAGSSTSRGKEM